MARRRLIPWWLLVGCLGGGAVVTVLVSWAMALHSDTRLVTRPAKPEWPVEVGTGWPAKPRFGTSLHRLHASEYFPGATHETAWGNHSGNYSGDYKLFVTRAGWPLLSMRSALLFVHPNNRIDRDGRHDVPDNEGTFDAGWRVAFEHTRPQESGGDGWLGRRAPLRPIWPGFAVNSLLSGAVLLGLSILLRLQPPRKARTWRPRWNGLLTVAAFAAAMNSFVALGLWARWQFRIPSRELHYDLRRAGVSVEQGAATLPMAFADWPADVPASWPSGPKWIGWMGESPGVRMYEFTSESVPSVAAGWIHVSWGSGAFNDHQMMLVVQTGWPLPCLQSEELLAHDDPPDDGKETDEVLRAIRKHHHTGPLVRTGGGAGVLMTSAPAPSSSRDPQAFVPLRPLALGMVLNTLLFAVPIALVLWAPGAVRTLRRRRKGCCAACGYSLAGLDEGAACPECGRGRDAD
ncbi:MAG TPA: hypothetical protein VFF65_10315 [Phycisphaerales bacterium]|nr:hypothetical protein [Phycisphaerales bacterium]